MGREQAQIRRRQRRQKPIPNAGRQPAMRHALNRLSYLIKDWLFIRTPEGRCRWRRRVDPIQTSTCSGIESVSFARPEGRKARPNARHCVAIATLADHGRANIGSLQQLSTKVTPSFRAVRVSTHPKTRSRHQKRERVLNHVDMP